MKITIRNGVFETNSSSTHSLIIKPSNEDSIKYAFKLTKPLEKIIWFCAVLNNCEEMYNGRLCWTDKSQKELKQELIEKAKNLWENNYDNVFYYVQDEEKFVKELNDGTVDTGDLIWFLDQADENYYDYINEEYKALLWETPRNKLLNLKQKLIEEYSKMENITEDEFWDRVVKEYNKKYDRQVCSRCDINFSCTRFFSEGAIEDCDCGFGTYSEMYDRMWVYTRDENAKKFLCENVAVYGFECWAYAGSLKIKK